jgi:hypothetical protein
MLTSRFKQQGITQGFSQNICVIELRVNPVGVKHKKNASKDQIA